MKPLRTTNTRFSRSWLIVLLGVISLVALPLRGQPSTNGYISIDCGITSNYSYYDPTIQIHYVSDDQYIDRGSKSSISSAYTRSSLIYMQLATVRSFPDGARNCYTIPVTQYVKYLVRATFMYGNYDGLNSATSSNPLLFDLHLGVNLWRTVNITYPSNVYSYEALSVAMENFISVCLINTNQGTPFISALELRPLKDTIYTRANATQTLILYFRYNMGTLIGEIVRYPDDPYDRIWLPVSQYPSWITMFTNSVVNNYQNDQFEAPSKVLQTAFMPVNSNEMNFSWNYQSYDTNVNEFYSNLHFAEILALPKNITREFNIYLNNDLWYGPFSPSYLMSDAIYSDNPMFGYDLYNYSIVATRNSTLTPLLNAWEVYFPMKITDIPTNQSDVDGITAIKEQYKLMKNWTGDPCAPRLFAWDGLSCSYNIDSPRITSINLSSNALTGKISSSFISLTEIQILDLSYNNLTGNIPDKLGSLSSLKVLNLTGNILTGPIPDSINQKIKEGQLTFVYANSTIPQPQPIQKDHKKTIIIVVSSVVPTVLVILLILIVWGLRRNRQGLPNLNAPKFEKGEDHHAQIDGHKFTYSGLTKVTNNFSLVIGKGGFGNVYFGKQENGSKVAVKLMSQSSTQDPREFVAEAQNLTRLHHRNLVSLIGYCIDGNCLALVYEYMPLGSLQEHLKGKVDFPRRLTWADRLYIAYQAAEGLDYLHRGCQPPIIHRDVKSSNILLGKGLEAKIADFGLSKPFLNEFDTHVSTQRLVGTPGYVDPLYNTTFQLNEKIDVYSFGIVLLELLTGRPPIIPGPERGHIVQWLTQRLGRGNIDDFIDKGLLGDYEANSVWKVVDIAIRCTALSYSQRPTMAEVVVHLRESIELEGVTHRSDTSALGIERSIPEAFGPSAR